MKLPLKWVNSLANFTCTPQEFTDRMTMSGSKVEGFVREADKMQNVVVAQIATMKRHPDSDHLWICSVNIGEDENVQIVTGAQNLKEGDLCPAALAGAKLPNGMDIKKGKLRGIESNGMLCSLGELGLTLNDFPSAKEDGILVFDEDLENIIPGMQAAIALGMDDYSFEFEITPNRPDCLSVRGLAREAAATFKVPFLAKEPILPKATGNGKIAEYLSVQVQAKETCLRYSVAIVENVRVAKSPRWLRERLRLSGVRPINNIVDITNYVMLEYGQPMHAFDHAYVKGKKIVVRMASKGETIITLDGMERKLENDMTVIADEKGPIALAGVMGGEYSGVYDSTKCIVFESACFDGPSVRSASRRLGLRTESSSRFEKGLNPGNASAALARALELVVELDAGDVVDGVIDIFPAPREERKIGLRPDAINKLLGVSISSQEMIDILLPLGFTVRGEEITVPADRHDVSRYNDFAEEIARFIGYNNLPSTMLSGVAAARLSPKQSFTTKLGDVLVGYGFWECETFSFYSPKGFDLINLNKDSILRNAIKLMHPLGEDTSIMRTTALPSIMEVAARNWASRNETAALFELATEYTQAENIAELPIERQKFVLAAYGAEWDYFAMKGATAALFATAGITEYEVRRNTDGESYHPGRCADFFAKDENGKELHIGRVGEIHPIVNENYNVKPRIVAAEIWLDMLFALRGASPQYVPLPKFPATTRDLALVANDDVPAAEIAARIRKGVGKRLESLSLFDVYTGESVGEGKKSLAYSLVLRDANGTLTDEDADRAVNKVLKNLAEINVVLRS